MHRRILPGKSVVLMFKEWRVTKLLCFYVVFRPYTRFELSLVQNSSNGKLSLPSFLKVMGKTADQG